MKKINLTLKEKCQLALVKGYTYNPETGHIRGASNVTIRFKNPKGYITFNVPIEGHDVRTFSLKAHEYGYFIMNKTIYDGIRLSHTNGKVDDNRWVNIKLFDYEAYGINNPIVDAKTREQNIDDIINDALQNWNFVNDGFYVTAEKLVELTKLSMDKVQKSLDGIMGEIVGDMNKDLHIEYYGYNKYNPMIKALNFEIEQLKATCNALRDELGTKRVNDLFSNLKK